MKRHEVNAADYGHVLYEAADAKKQPGQQLVHEAMSGGGVLDPEQGGGQKSRNRAWQANAT